MTATPGLDAPTATAETAPARVQRFSRAERAIHWIHAGAFFALLITGLVLYVPALAGTLGSRATMKGIHLASAAAWAVGLLVAVALADRRRLGRTLREIESFGARDRRWALGRPSPVGRFNPGQKAHAIVQAAFAALFVITGLLLVAGETYTRLRLAGTLPLHDGLTVLATLLVAGHLYLALIHPPTRPSLRGAFDGSVPAAWARAHHGAWQPEPPPASGTATRARRSLTVVLLAAAAALAIAAAILIPSTTAGGPGAAGAGPGAAR